MALVERDDEAGARKFLIDNMQKFPEEMREKLTFAFFEEALMTDAKGTKEITEMQKQGLDAMSQIEKAKKVLEDKKKVQDLRSQLTK